MADEAGLLMQSSKFSQHSHRSAVNHPRSAVAKDTDSVNFANALAMAIGQLANQGTGKEAIVDPAILERRYSARQVDDGPDRVRPVQERDQPWSMA